MLITDQVATAPYTDTEHNQLNGNELGLYVVFDSMQALGKIGVLVLSSVTGGNRMVEVPADKINLEFVLGNKVMVGTVNANREYFEMGVKDLAQAEAEYPGWLSRLLTHPVRGLENYQELFAKLTDPNGAIKVFCEVAEL